MMLQEKKVQIDKYNLNYIEKLGINENSKNFFYYMKA
jgi:hypothetical protein